MKPALLWLFGLNYIDSLLSEFLAFFFSIVRVILFKSTHFWPDYNQESAGSNNTLMYHRINIVLEKRTCFLDIVIILVIEARLFYFYTPLQDNFKCYIYFTSGAKQVLWQDNIFTVPKIFFLTFSSKSQHQKYCVLAHDMVNI